jgi:hypothetical protein
MILQKSQVDFWGNISYFAIVFLDKSGIIIFGKIDLITGS